MILKGGTIKGGPNAKIVKNRFNLSFGDTCLSLKILKGEAVVKFLLGNMKK
jgi:hypothetical protein